jgi:tetratricopeptide (TPR) repeat protein
MARLRSVGLQPDAASTVRVLVAASTAALLAAGAMLHAQPAPKPAVGSRLEEASRALAAGDSERALRLGEAYLKQHPADPSARVLMARAHLARADAHPEELSAAYDHLRRALRAATANEDVLYYLGLVTGRLSQAEFQRLVAMAPDSARVHQLMAESFEAQERRTEAEAEYAAALEKKPDLLDALLGLAKLKRIRLDYEGAIPLYEKAEAIRPTFDGAYGLGTCHLRRHENEAAVANFERAVERNPQSAIALVGLGSALLGLGRTADAISRLERAVKLEPRMSEAYYVLGRSYQMAGETSRAQEAYATAERLRTSPPGE